MKWLIWSTGFYYVFRDAEERYETCQKEVVQSSRKLKESQQENDELRNELRDERQYRKG